jgi:hypothetical protein
MSIKTVVASVYMQKGGSQVRFYTHTLKYRNFLICPHIIQVAPFHTRQTDIITFGVTGLTLNIHQSVKLTCQHILTGVIRWFQMLLPTALPSDYTPKLKNGCKLMQKFHDGAIYYQLFRQMCSLQLQARINPQGGGSRFVINTNIFVQDNTM